MTLLVTWFRDGLTIGIGGGGENGGDHKGERQLTFLPNFPANHSKLRKNCR